MEKTETSAEADQFKCILLDIVKDRLSCGTHQATILVALQDVMEFVQTIIDKLETSGQSPLVSCRSGCSYCCHSLIKVIPAEALLIDSFLRRNLLNNDIQILKTSILKYQLLVKGKTLKERVSIKDKTPCIFLKEDDCSIYPVRPFICRAWNSLDQSVCKSSFLSGNHNAEIETSPVRNYMFSTAREIFQEMDIQMLLNTGLYDIPGAILDCLAHVDSLERWCISKPVFTQ
jgi:Fe-S-cluster containining protein